MTDDTLHHLLAALDPGTLAEAKNLRDQMVSVGLTDDQADELLTRTLQIRADNSQAAPDGAEVGEAS